MMNATGYHAVRVDELRHALNGLAAGDMVEPNHVQNLVVIREGEYVGYVDFGDAARLVMFNEGRET